MDVNNHPIMTCTLAVDFKASAIAVQIEQDLIFDASNQPLDTSFVSQYTELIEALTTPSFSRVLIVDTNQLGLFPDHCVVVPTLGEAKDLIELERIERDLGF
ncbi:MAG: hypothetical protein ACPHSE_01645 [Flavobacteriaceae bacterium]